MRLTPEIAYVFGIWKAFRSREGVGVCAPLDVEAVFIKEALRLGLTESNKILRRGACTFFYHSKLKRFFHRLYVERPRRFKYRNAYSANYFAGLFDATGEMTPLRFRGDEKDEICLSLLGFAAGRRGAWIYPAAAFLIFISPFLKLKNHPQKLKTTHKEE